MRIGGRRVVMALVVAGLAAACTSESESAPRAEVDGTVASTTSSSSSTTEPALTTLPARQFEPLLADPALTLEEQVEAAYLFHWEVLLDAGRTGSIDQLHLIYDDEMLAFRRNELTRLVEEGLRVFGYVEHDYVIETLGDDEAIVIDAYRNFMTRVPAGDGEPEDLGSGAESVVEYQMRRVDGRWLVSHIVQYDLQG